jgi:hypothetical protein
MIQQKSLLKPNNPSTSEPAETWASGVTPSMDLDTSGSTSQFGPGYPGNELDPGPFAADNSALYLWPTTVDGSVFTPTPESRQILLNSMEVLNGPGQGLDQVPSVHQIQNQIHLAAGAVTLGNDAQSSSTVSGIMENSENTYEDFDPIAWMSDGLDDFQCFSAANQRLKANIPHAFSGSGTPTDSLICGYSGCTKTFAREPDRLRHRKEHTETHFHLMSSESGRHPISPFVSTSGEVKDQSGRVVSPALSANSVRTNTNTDEDDEDENNEVSRDTLAGSLMQGMSWGGVSVGSWIRDEYVLPRNQIFSVFSFIF